LDRNTRARFSGTDYGRAPYLDDNSALALAKNAYQQDHKESSTAEAHQAAQSTPSTLTRVGRLVFHRIQSGHCFTL